MFKTQFEFHLTVNDANFPAEVKWSLVALACKREIHLFFNDIGGSEVSVLGGNKLKTFELLRAHDAGVSCLETDSAHSVHRMFSFQVELQHSSALEPDFAQLEERLKDRFPGLFSRVKVEVPSNFLDRGGPASAGGLYVPRWKYAEAHIVPWPVEQVSLKTLTNVVEEFNAAGYSEEDGGPNTQHGMRILLSQRVRKNKPNKVILTVRAMRRSSVDTLSLLVGRGDRAAGALSKAVQEFAPEVELNWLNWQSLKTHQELVVYDSNPDLDAVWDPRMKTTDPVLRISRGLDEETDASTGPFKVLPAPMFTTRVRAPDEAPEVPALALMKTLMGSDEKVPEWGRGFLVIWSGKRWTTQGMTLPKNKIGPWILLPTNTEWKEAVQLLNPPSEAGLSSPSQSGTEEAVAPAEGAPEVSAKALRCAVERGLQSKLKLPEAVRVTRSITEHLLKKGIAVRKDD